MSPRKIVIIGPESTGKSTLSAALAEALDTVWVPEYARAYLEGLGRPYEEADLLRIPIKKPAHGELTVDQQAYNAVHGALRCLGERANSLLKTTFKALRRWRRLRYHPATFAEPATVRRSSPKE